MSESARHAAVAHNLDALLAAHALGRHELVRPVYDRMPAIVPPGATNDGCRLRLPRPNWSGCSSRTLRTRWKSC